jgi:hemin uptake protein HemP
MNRNEEGDDKLQSGSQRSTSEMPRTIAIVGGKIESRDLLIGTREVMINHRDETYRLRVTSQNKLILTK